MKWIGWIACALFAALFVVVLILYLRQRNLLRFTMREEQRLRIQAVGTPEQERARKQIELSYLRSQINPHFLYNTLDSIRSQALQANQHEIAKATETLSHFFRYCISGSDALVTVGEEIRHIEDYFYIQKYRFEDRFLMSIHMESEYINDLYLPKMTLQPIVENALIHGLEKVPGQGHITLRLFCTQNRLTIVVSDDGAGMSAMNLDKLNSRMENESSPKPTSSSSRHSGIALRNVSTQIRIIFGNDYGIRYHSIEGEGTDAFVTLPVVDVFTRAGYENRMESGAER
ncbi:MAG: histidine kinase [Clostridiales bacterium]|nr:histidine kinase [Clostridiales bacterium]